jgi:glycosyltransferase involved in cell wall biosynthesis
MPKSDQLISDENSSELRSSNMKVLFISHVSIGENLYGAARSLVYLIEGLRERGVEPFVILPGDGSHLESLNPPVEYRSLPFNKWAKDQRGPVKRILNTLSQPVFALLAAVWAVIWRVDIVYTNSITTPVGALAAALIRKPHVLHIREFGWEDYRLRFDLGERFSVRLLNRLTYRVIVISEALKAKYKRYFPERKMTVVYNPVSADDVDIRQHVTQEMPDNNLPLAVIVGRVHPAKGQEEAVRAAADLNDRGNPICLWIVGGGEEEYLDELQRLARELGVKDYVHFAGYRKDASQLMAAADFVLVCSRAEAFGRVTAEAMLVGAPVVGARSGATPELVRDRQEGLLYEPGDHQELARSIEYLMKHPEEAREMGEKGQQRAVREFTIEEYIDRVFNILAELARGSE